MLKPHLLLTVLVLALVVGLAAHMATQQHWSWSNNGNTSVSADRGNGADDKGNSASGNGYSSGDGYRNGNSDSNGGERNVPGQFDYYALVLSWSPTYCSNEGEDDDTQCNRRDGRRYSFVLHGLWPQYERGYPSACHLSRRPFVPEPVISSMLDIMPSRGLVIHEYRTHGTCSGLDPSRYFATAHRLFEGIKIPERFRNPFQAQFVAPSDVRNEFLRANPDFTPDMMAIVCGGSGKALKEVRFCYSKDGHPRACGQNENQNKLCSTDRVFVPPARSTARQDAPDRQQQSTPVAPSLPKSYQGSPLPGPRMDYDYGHQSQ
jgi:ribonuclease T2